MPSILNADSWSSFTRGGLSRFLLCEKLVAYRRFPPGFSVSVGGVFRLTRDPPTAMLAIMMDNLRELPQQPRDAPGPTPTRPASRQAKKKAYEAGKRRPENL